MLDLKHLKNKQTEKVKLFKVPKQLLNQCERKRWKLIQNMVNVFEGFGFFSFSFSAALPHAQLLPEAATAPPALITSGERGAALGARRAVLLPRSHPHRAGCEPKQRCGPAFRKAFSKEIQETLGMPLSIKE